MPMKAIVGNAIIATGGYISTKSVALAATSGAVPTYYIQLADPYMLVGFTVPNWLGVVFFIISLLFGTIASINQPTPVDIQFKHQFLKPFYSLGFGILMSLFVVPQFYPAITVWTLILPAFFFAAIGSVVIFYIIAFFKSEKLWSVITLEAHKSAPELIAIFFDWGKGVLKALVGRSDK